jgi:hypothetical protein
MWRKHTCTAMELHALDHGYRVFRTSENVEFTFNKFTIAKSEFVKLLP